MPRYFALIAAAGVGARFGGETPKQYLKVAGKSLIDHSVHLFLATAEIERVYVALAPADSQWRRSSWASSQKVNALPCGGATRAESVNNALQAIGEAASDEDWILVHDAARPCLAARHLRALFDGVAEDAVGGLLALPVADTLKRADRDGRAAATEPREGLWCAQTPQMFRYGVLRQALRRADLGRVTDEASAVEQLGLRPKLIPADASNLKVTYAEDLALAELILRTAGELSLRIGQGFDVHPFAADRELVIGGVSIAHDRGLAGHSDADVLLHAICDALLGAAGLGDIGRLYPDTDAAYRGIDSRKLLRDSAQRLAASGYRVVNVDATVIAQAPRLAPYMAQMAANIAEDLHVATDRVNVKATTTERLGFVGRGEGIAAQAVVLLDLVEAVFR